MDCGRFQSNLLGGRGWPQSAQHALVLPKRQMTLARGRTPRMITAQGKSQVKPCSPSLKPFWYPAACLPAVGRCSFTALSAASLLCGLLAWHLVGRKDDSALGFVLTMIPINHEARNDRATCYCVPLSQSHLTGSRARMPASKRAAHGAPGRKRQPADAAEPVPQLGTAAGHKRAARPERPPRPRNGSSAAAAASAITRRAGDHIVC